MAENWKPLNGTGLKNLPSSLQPRPLLEKKGRQDAKYEPKAKVPHNTKKCDPPLSKYKESGKVSENENASSLEISYVMQRRRRKALCPFCRMTQARKRSRLLYSRFLCPCDVDIELDVDAKQDVCGARCPSVEEIDGDSRLGNLFRNLCIMERSGWRDVEIDQEMFQTPAQSQQVEAKPTKRFLSGFRNEMLANGNNNALGPFSSHGNGFCLKHRNYFVFVDEQSTRENEFSSNAAIHLCQSEIVNGFVEVSSLSLASSLGNDKEGSRMNISIPEYPSNPKKSLSDGVQADPRKSPGVLQLVSHQTDFDLELFAPRIEFVDFLAPYLYKNRSRLNSVAYRKRPSSTSRLSNKSEHDFPRVQHSSWSVRSKGSKESINTESASPKFLDQVAQEHTGCKKLDTSSELERVRIRKRLSACFFLLRARQLCSENTAFFKENCLIRKKNKTCNRDPFNTAKYIQNPDEEEVLISRLRKLTTGTTQCLDKLSPANPQDLQKDEYEVQCDIKVCNTLKNVKESRFAVKRFLCRNNSNDAEAPKEWGSQPPQAAKDQGQTECEGRPQYSGRVIRVEGDGRCLFRSLVVGMIPRLQQCTRDEFGRSCRSDEADEETMYADILRQQVVFLMWDNIQFYAELEKGIINADQPRNCSTQYERFKDRLDAMSNPTTMPGDLELNAVAMALEKRVVVLNTDLRLITIYGHERYPQGPVLAVRYTRLGEDVGHYDAVILDDTWDFYYGRFGFGSTESKEVVQGACQNLLALKLSDSRSGANAPTNPSNGSLPPTSRRSSSTALRNRNQALLKRLSEDCIRRSHVSRAASVIAPKPRSRDRRRPLSAGRVADPVERRLCGSHELQPDCPGTVVKTRERRTPLGLDRNYSSRCHSFKFSEDDLHRFHAAIGSRRFERKRKQSNFNNCGSPPRKRLTGKGGKSGCHSCCKRAPCGKKQAPKAPVRRKPRPYKECNQCQSPKRPKPCKKSKQVCAGCGSQNDSSGDEQKRISREKKSRTFGKEKGSSGDEKGSSGGEKGSSGDEKGSSGDEKGSSDGKRGSSSDKRDSSSDKKKSSSSSDDSDSSDSCRKRRKCMKKKCRKPCSPCKPCGSKDQLNSPCRRYRCNPQVFPSLLFVSSCLCMFCNRRVISSCHGWLKCFICSRVAHNECALGQFKRRCPDSDSSDKEEYKDTYFVCIDCVPTLCKRSSSSSDSD